MGHAWYDKWSKLSRQLARGIRVPKEYTGLAELRTMREVTYGKYESIGES